jgi:hypothetical protein
VFVVDLTSEAAEVTRALRAAGHTVVDVLPSMLVARVAVQRPGLVLIDADSEGALDVVERMRELPEAEDIHVLFVARPGGAITSAEEALAHEGSGFFVRPVDIAEITRKVELLTAGVRSDHHPMRANMPPSPVETLPVKGMGSAPSLPPASMRASIPPAASDTKSSAPPSPRASKSPSDPPSAALMAGPRRVMSLAPPVSSELQQLLAEAEQRVQVQVEHESIVPSPEDEIEAVLPADLLAALDEPLDEDDDDEDPIVLPRSPASFGAVREKTGARGSSRATRGVGIGAAPTTSSVPRTGPEGRPHETPATPSPAHTHGGTHAGPTGEGVSTTGGSDAREPSDAAARTPEGSVPPPAWAAGTSTTGAQSPDSLAPSRANEPSIPVALETGDAMRMTARAIAARTTGSMCIATPDTERRIVLREGDMVTASSTAEEESLLAFLGVRGDLPRETVRRLAPKFPTHGRHAGAALVARGYLLQDQMWPTLRAHAEWLLAHLLQTASGRMVVEAHPPGRLAGEPSVFGGSTGAAVFVEVVRRIVPPAEAIERLGGLGSKIGEGAEARLLEECALDSSEIDQVRAAPGRMIHDVLDGAPEGDLATVIFALSQLAILDIQRGAGDHRAGAGDRSALDVSAIDAEAVRERVRARLQLVDDGDYFALLGVPRDATGYEVRRAFLELRRAFDPSRLLAPEVSDLIDDVRKITAVLEEAYDILKDAARRERYRRAIDAVPDR